MAGEPPLLGVQNRPPGSTGLAGRLYRCAGVSLRDWGRLMSRSMSTGCLCSPYTLPGRVGALLILSDLLGGGGECALKGGALGLSGDRIGTGGGSWREIRGEGVRAVRLGPGVTGLSGAGGGAGRPVYSGACGGESNDRPGVLTGIGAYNGALPFALVEGGGLGGGT
jgi:hypothetical protein